MAGRLDRYVSKAVYGAYAAGLVFLIGLMALLDVLMNLAGYLDSAAERDVGVVSLFVLLAEFYVVNVPFLFVMIAPFVTVIAGMFAVARLMGANEVVPMIFTGRNMLRVLRPLLFVGAMSAGAMVACWQYVIPALTETHERLRSELQGDAITIEDLVVRLREGDERTMFADAYDPHAKRITRLQYINRGSTLADTMVTTARFADWNPESEVWDLTQGEEHGISTVRSVATLDVSLLTPELLSRTSKESKELVTLSYSELRDLQQLAPGRRDFVLAFQHHLTFPLANLILLMLALPFSVHFERGRKIERVLFAVLVCALYLLADLTCQNLSRSGYFHPIFAAWLPPIVFGSLGGVFLGSIKT